jgi:hypothetical protein
MGGTGGVRDIGDMGDMGDIRDIHMFCANISSVSVFCSQAHLKRRPVCASRISVFRPPSRRRCVCEFCPYRHPLSPISPISPIPPVPYIPLYLVDQVYQDINEFPGISIEDIIC